MKKLTIKYLPDIITIIGIFLLSYNLLRPETISGGLHLPSLSSVDYHTEYKVLGIVLIVIGVDVAIRRYLNFKDNKK